MMHPDWKMPEGFESDLPKALTDYVLQGLRDGEPVKMTRGRLRAIEILRKMHADNREQDPPPVDLNLNVSGDLLDALNAVGGMTPEQRAKLAEADRILDEAGRSEQASGQAPVPDLGGSHSVG